MMIAAEIQDRSRAAQEQGRFLKPAYVLLWLFLLIGAVYLNSLGNGFVFDDLVGIDQNSNLRLNSFAPADVVDFFVRIRGDVYRNRPIPMLSFALNRWAGEFRPFGYHLVNVLIHGLTAFFLFLFFRETLRIHADPGQSSAPAEYQAFAAACLWSLHPLHTESVAYVLQRMTSMGAMFYMVSFVCYIRGRREMREGKLEAQRSKGEEGRGERREANIAGRAWIWFTCCIAAGLLAFGSKEITVTLPFMILLYEWYFFRDLNIRWLGRVILFLGAILICLLLLAVIYRGGNPIETMMQGYETREFSLFQRLMTEWRVVIFYISQIFWPIASRLNLDHDYPLSFSPVEPVTTVLSLTAIVLLALFAVHAACKKRLLSFAILWYLGNLAIESSFVELEIIFEHRTYLPSMMIVLPVVTGVSAVVRNKGLRRGLAVSIMVVLFLSTMQRNRIWRDSLALWKDCADKSPAKARTHLNLGNELLTSGAVDEAESRYRRALALDPRLAAALANMGRIRMGKNHAEEGIRYYRKALAIDPNHFMANYNLGEAMTAARRWQEAEDYYRRALRASPDFVEALFALGKLYAGQGKWGDAAVWFQKVVDLKPDHGVARYFLGLSMHKAGRVADAATHLEAASILIPNEAKVHFSLGQAYFEQKRMEEALRACDTALRLSPNPVVLNFHGVVLHRMGRVAEARADFERAVALDPNYADARRNLEAIARVGSEKRK